MFGHSYIGRTGQNFHVPKGQSVEQHQRSKIEQQSRSSQPIHSKFTTKADNFCKKSNFLGKANGQIRIQIANIRVGGVRFRTARMEGRGKPAHLADTNRWRSARQNLARGRRRSPCSSPGGLVFDARRVLVGEEGEFLVDFDAEFVGRRRRRHDDSEHRSRLLKSPLPYIISIV